MNEFWIELNLLLVCRSSPRCDACKNQWNLESLCFSYLPPRHQQCIVLFLFFYCFFPSSLGVKAFSFTITVPWCINHKPFHIMQNRSFLVKWQISGRLDRRQAVIPVPSTLTRTGRWFTHGESVCAWEREGGGRTLLPTAPCGVGWYCWHCHYFFLLLSNSFPLLGFTIGHSEQAWAPWKGRRDIDWETIYEVYCRTSSEHNTSD